MSQKNETVTSRYDTLKWLMVGVLLVAGAIADHFVVIPAPLEIIGWIILIGIVGTIAALTATGKSMLKFFAESRMEIRKVVWPTRQETVQTTLIVMVLVLVIAFILWVIDSGLIYLIGWVTGQG